MADAPIMLGDLLLDTAGTIDRVIAAGAVDEPDAAMINRAIGSLGASLDAGVRAACNRDLIGLLIEGWSKAVELRDYGDTEKHPPPMTVRMALGKHPMTIAIDPGLTLVIGRTFRFPLKFVVDFSATIEAAQLTIIDGAIDAVDVGTLALSAKLRWGTTEVPLPLKTREIALPGKFALDPRFKIPR